MRACGSRLPVQLVMMCVSLAAGCASNPSPVARRAEPVDLNARTAARTAAVGDERFAPRDIARAEAARYGRMEELLAHRAPMLDVRPRGGGRFVLTIRGRPVQAGAAAPLVVIDGVPFRDGVDMLAQLSPSDVRRIEVLRDAASTSAYGYRGANGVIVVTTQRGRD